MPSVSGKPWITIKTKVEKNKMRYVQSRIEGWPDEAFVKYYFQSLQTITAEAADIQRNYLNTRPNYTPTGEKRKAAGGNGPGRVDTGYMRDMITSNAGGSRGAIKQKDGHYLFRFGWLDGVPGYAIFQEYGTQGGIKAMHSQRYAAEFAREMIKDLGASSKSGRVTAPKKFGATT